MDGGTEGVEGPPRQGSGRDETPEERSDRKWDDLLQELRVVQTGTQLTAGFLLTLPFQDRFARLGDGERALYLGIVVLALVTTALVMTPLAVHRRLTGRHAKHQLVETAQRMVTIVLAAVALLILAISVFVFQVVLGRVAAIAVGVPTATVLAALLVVVPRLVVRAAPAQDPSGRGPRLRSRSR